MAGEQRRFRFGVIGETIRSGEQLIGTATRAEELGYTTLLLRDHFVREPFGDQLAPMLALMAAAGATRTLRVGTQVLDNDYRHPVLLAKEAATLDLLSGGRLELGIGAGWLREEYVRAGMAFDAAGTRVSRLEESIRILKELFAGSPVSARGSHYRISGLESFPQPVQRPHPPLLVGAGSRRMLGIAGREADIVGILPKALPDGTISDELSERSPETIARKVDWVREAAGGRATAVELSMMISFSIADDYRAEAERLATSRGWGSEAASSVLRMPGLFVGTAERIAEEMQLRRERYGFSYYVVSDRRMDAFGPVVERLNGR
ncbi:MAG TPA: TIGR03621 family F420-dependent LLM class oxidoreductase [Actinomycetes bacterium]|nr:TIGR03621 family F420-dependent LLM class oxidoreductase [Actinomycetes bacterium]